MKLHPNLPIFVCNSQGKNVVRWGSLTKFTGLGETFCPFWHLFRVHARFWSFDSIMPLSKKRSTLDEYKYLAGIGVSIRKKISSNWFIGTRVLELQFESQRPWSDKILNTWFFVNLNKQVMENLPFHLSDSSAASVQRMCSVCKFFGKLYEAAVVISVPKLLTFSPVWLKCGVSTDDLSSIYVRKSHAILRFSPDLKTTQHWPTHAAWNWNIICNLAALHPTF